MKMNIKITMNVMKQKITMIMYIVMFASSFYSYCWAAGSFGLADISASSFEVAIASS